MKSNDAQHGSYKEQLLDLQIQLVKLQRHIIKDNLQLLVIFEGRDAAGKDGVIKRIIQHLSPREVRVVALGKPSEKDISNWYFQRYVSHLPSKQEMVLMNRSWYNRAGVEKVMGFCNKSEYDDFMQSVVPFEKILCDTGIQVIKYYLDISKSEQQERLEDRRKNPLKQWKISPIDESAIEYWDEYSSARTKMLKQTHSDHAPWHIVNANNKKQARLNIIRHLLSVVECPDMKQHLIPVDSNVIFPFATEKTITDKLYR